VGLKTHPTFERFANVPKAPKPAFESTILGNFRNRKWFTIVTSGVDFLDRTPVFWHPNQQQSPAHPPL